ncbi:MAG: hypothetical protein MUC47_07855 [Candidatus Kapabacteria bacterium]|nr:hypothetical protein [Candidatus Kapabacteria bacterium]
MPTYDYACITCGARFDVVQSMKDDALTRCPAELCTGGRPGDGHIERRISAGAGVIYKGDGFYLTDYSRKARSSSPASESSSTTSSDTSTSPAPSASPSPSSSSPAPAASSTD